MHVKRHLNCALCDAFLFEEAEAVPMRDVPTRKWVLVSAIYATSQGIVESELILLCFYPYLYYTRIKNQ